MELWTRDEDHRWYAYNLERDLYGPAVVVYYGGERVARTRIIPVDSTEDGERMLDQLASRRRQHGYRLASAI